MAREQAATVAATAGGRRGRKPRFTRGQLAQITLELIDRDGLDVLSMQRVAERAGVGTMTLYGYFRSKDELLQAVVDAAVQPSEPLSIEGSWQEQMRAVVGAAHRTLTRHPALVEIRFRQPILRPDALHFGERVVGILREAGFDDVEAANAFRLIFTYTFGFAGLSPARATDQAREQARRAAATLPPEEFPNLRATAAAWTRAMAGSDQFQYGLDRILDGLQARLAGLP
jgi:AcrR family transcriptional regulator